MALEAGFDLVRFGPADTGSDGERFLSWLDAGRAGDMDYLERNREKIADPRAWAPEARSTVALAYDYGGPPGQLTGGGRVARYAVGRDYHRFLGKSVQGLRRELERDGAPRGSIKVGTDAVPVLERALSARAGVGFLAKSAGVISPTLGPYLLLAELLVPDELPWDPPAPGTCGSCTRCIDACPTDAIVAPFQVDARRCVSYTTIERRGSIPRELRKPQGAWLFGCDVCLEVCPFTNRGRATAPPAAPRPAPLQPHSALERYSLVAILELSQGQWDHDWTGTAVRRATRSGLRRNAAVVLGNLRDASAVPALSRALQDPDPIVRSHAGWALGQIQPTLPALQRAADGDPNPAVRDELRLARDGQ